MKNVNYKKLILPNIPYVFIALFATKLGQAARLTPGTDFSSKALNFMQGLTLAFENIMPSFHPIDLLVGVVSETRKPPMTLSFRSKTSSTKPIAEIFR